MRASARRGFRRRWRVPGDRARRPIRGSGGGASTQIRSTPSASSSRNTENNSCAAAIGLRRHAPASCRALPAGSADAAGIYRQLQRARPEHLQRRVQHRRRPSGAAGRAARSAPPACPRRAARARPASRSGSPAAASMRGARQHARAQQHRVAARAVDDGRLDAHRAGAAVEHQQRRRRTPRPRGRRGVGLMRPKRLALGAATPATPSSRAARSRAWATGCAGQRRPMLSCPPAAAAATPGARGTITVSGPGQKASIRRCATGGTAAAKARALGSIGHVHDQRVVGRPALGGEDACHRRVVVGARAEAVDGLGREGHELAGGQARSAATAAAIVPSRIASPCVACRASLARHAQNARHAEQRRRLQRHRRAPARRWRR